MSIPKDLNLQRYLTEPDAMIYYQVGRNSLRAKAEELNAVRHFGRRRVYDRVTLDAGLERESSEKATAEDKN